MSHFLKSAAFDSSWLQWGIACMVP